MFIDFFAHPQMDWSNVIQGMMNDTREFIGDFGNIISIGRDSVRHLNQLLDDKCVSFEFTIV